MVVFYTLLSVIGVSLISLLGVLFLVLSRKVFNQIIFLSLAFSSGVLLATSFLDLYPESLKKIADVTPLLTLLGIVTFFIVEKLINWHHCAEGEDCQEKPLAYLSLVGDAVHNFADGVAIAAAYLTSFPLGISTTLAVVAHEIPHELSDFSLLIYGGFSNRKAVFYNFLSALTAIAGAVFVLLLTTNYQNLTNYLLPITAGNFIYIAAADLFPELRKKRSLSSTLVQSLLISGGILLILSLKLFMAEP